MKATNNRNLDAETAFDIAVAVLGGSSNFSEQELAYMWERCHADTDLQWLVTKFLASNSDYAPTAKQKVIEKVKEVFA